jgi:hypothetical protein
VCDGGGGEGGGGGGEEKKNWEGKTNGCVNVTCVRPSSLFWEEVPQVGGHLFQQEPMAAGSRSNHGDGVGRQRGMGQVALGLELGRAP